VRNLGVNTIPPACAAPAPPHSVAGELAVELPRPAVKLPRPLRAALSGLSEALESAGAAASDGADPGSATVSE
jgi:hypothetical protein